MFTEFLGDTQDDQQVREDLDNLFLNEDIHGLMRRGRYTTNSQNWARNPDILWNACFSVHSLFSGQTLNFAYSGATDGKSLNLLYYHTKHEKAHKADSKAVLDHQRPVNEYPSTDFRYSGNQNLSSLAGDWVKNINSENPKSTGLSGLKGFKGVIDIDKHHGYFDGGIETLKDLTKKHPIVGIDLGLKNLISMVVMDAKVGYFISLTIDLTIDFDKT